MVMVVTNVFEYLLYARLVFFVVHGSSIAILQMSVSGLRVINFCKVSQLVGNEARI